MIRDILHVVKFKDWRNINKALLAGIRDKRLFNLVDKQQHDYVLFRVPENKIEKFRRNILRVYRQANMEIEFILTYTEFYLKGIRDQQEREKNFNVN